MNQSLLDLSRQLGMLLSDQGMTIATAESCTGGGISQIITEVPSSSGWFECGFITYSNRAKEQMLSVKPETLNQFGAVSRAVVIEMVEGALNHSQADVAVAVTGIAGPDGGTQKKPVGTVFLAYQLRGQPVNCTQLVLSGKRAEIRQQTIRHALMMGLELL